MKAQNRGAGPRATYTRRAAIGIGAAALAGAAIGGDAATAAASPSPRPVDLLTALRPEIAPRSTWGADRPVTAPIVAEDDVRFLLVHHTASTNDYQSGDVAEQIRGFHRFHTGPEKGWPDVAYNFFVDRFGGIWEARQGSIDGPVRGDATGGSQGFALLCSLIGDHGQGPVTDEAMASLVALLAWLAERHGIDTEPGATADFVSRGSNRWPTGAQVTAATISGHRDMSQTSCPGDFAYDRIAAELPGAVNDRRLRVAAATTTTTPAPTLVQPAPETPSTEPATPSSTEPTPDPAEAAADPSSSGTLRRVDTDVVVPIAAIGGAAAVGGAAAIAAAAAVRRRNSTDESG